MLITREILIFVKYTKLPIKIGIRILIKNTKNLRRKNENVL